MRHLAIYIIYTFIVFSCIAQNKGKLELDSTIDSISSNGDEIGFIISNRYLLYGTIDTVYSDNEKGFSDIRVLDAFYNDSRRFKLSGNLFCNRAGTNCMPLEYVKVSKGDSELNLTYYLTVPSGKGWKYELQPMIRQNLIFDDDSLFLAFEKFVMNFEGQVLNLAKRVVQDYKEIKVKGIDSYFNNQQGAEFVMDFQMRLIISAFYDDACEELLVSLPDDFPELTEGLLGEIYYGWAIIYNVYAKENSKLLIPFL